MLANTVWFIYWLMHLCGSIYSSAASSTRGARSRFTTPDVWGAGVAVVVADADALESCAAGAGVDALAATDFLDFFFLVWWVWLGYGS